MDQYTKITIRLDVRLSEEERRALKLLLKDALGEFVSARSPAETYVERRYRGSGPLFREHKALDLRARIEMAKKVKAAVDDAAFEDPSDIDIE